jgi:small-conductance mechanosensitive channel
LPAVVILRRIIDRSLYPVLNGLVVVFVLEHVRETFLPLPVLPRLLFMAEMATILTLSAFWLRPGRAWQIPRELALRASIRIIAIGLRLSLAFAAIALFAEAAGFGALAYLIGKTLIFAGYAAVVLYGLARVLDGLFSFLLRVRPLRLLGSVRRNRALIQRRLILLIHVAGWYIWFDATLRRAELQDDVWGYFDGLMAAELPLPEVAITVGDIIACGLTFYAATLLSRLVRFSLEEEVYTRVRLPTGRTSGISTLIHYTILTMGLILAATALGFDANRFTLLAGAFGVGIGFGLQTIVNNFISGIILLTERPVEVGHTVELAEVFGEVTRIGIRSSTVRTWQGAEVIVPNADLISQQVTNWTLSDRRRRMEIPVGVEYGSDPKLIIETLVTAAMIDDRVLRFPEPYVLFMGFGDSSLDFELRAWTDDFDSFMRVRSAVCVAIVDALQAAGLHIPFPQRDLHVKTVVEQAGRSPREQEQPVPRTGPDSAPGSGTEQLDSEATRGDRRVG